MLLGFVVGCGRGREGGRFPLNHIHGWRFQCEWDLVVEGVCG